MRKFSLAILLVSVTSIGQIKFNAQISNPNSDSIVIHNKEFKITLKSDGGNFSEEFVAQRGFYQFFDGASFATLYLDDGFDLILEADAWNFAQTIRFAGIGSQENNFLVGKKKVDSEIKSSFGGTLPDDQTLQKILDKRYSDADKQLTVDDFNPNFRHLMLAEYRKEDVRIKQDLKQARLKILRQHIENPRD